MAKEKKVNERWEKIRMMGKTRFIWRHGVLGYGLLMFLAMEIILPPIKDGSLDFTKLLVRAGIWVAAGYLFGVLTWYFSEKERDKRKA